MVIRYFYFAVNFLYVLFSLQARADWVYNMPRGVTSISHKIYDLHMLIFYICLVICVGVFCVLFYAMYAFRKRPRAVSSDFHESFTIEFIGR